MKLGFFGLSSILGIFFSLFSSFSVSATSFYVPNLAPNGNQMLYKVYQPVLFNSSSIISISDVFANSTFNNQNFPFITQDYSQTRRDGNIIIEQASRCDWDDFRCVGSFNSWGFQYNLNLSESGFSNTDTLGTSSDRFQVYLVFTSESQISSWKRPSGYSDHLAGSDTNGDNFDYSRQNYSVSINNSDYSLSHGLPTYVCSSDGASYVSNWSFDSDDIETLNQSCSSYSIDGYSPFSYLEDTDYFYMVFSVDVYLNNSNLSSFTYSDISTLMISDLFAGISYTSVDSSSWQQLIRSYRGSFLTGNSIALDAIFVVSPDENGNFNYPAFADKNGSYDLFRYYEVDYSTERDKSNNYSNSLINLFDFTAINPFSGIFGMFTASGCASIPILASWINSPTSQVCPWFPASVSSVLTPVFEITAVMLIFGFFVRWLSSSSGNLFEDSSHEEVSNQGGKWGHFKKGGN